MRQYLVDYFSKSNLIDTFDTPKKKKKSPFYRYERRNGSFPRIVANISYFTLARYWRIAVAEPVFPGHGSSGHK